MIIEPTNNEQLFIDAYFEAVYFTDAGPDNPHPLEDPELSAYDIRRGTIDCLAFFQANEHRISDALTVQAGHDFWLTRNGHGTGFWDRDDSYGDYSAKKLTSNAEAFGVVDVEFIKS